MSVGQWAQMGNPHSAHIRLENYRQAPLTDNHAKSKTKHWQISPSNIVKYPQHDQAGFTLEYETNSAHEAVM